MSGQKSSSISLLLLLPVAVFAASPIQERADRFLKLANAGYQALFRVNSEAQWLAVTDVSSEHDAAVEATGKAYAAFNGNPAIINEARELLTHQKELNELTVRQFKQLLLNAAEGPMTNPDLVAKRVAAETKQASILNSFEFKLNDQKITANEIDNKLEKSTDLNERGVLPADFKPDKTAFLLDDALARSVPFIYFSCGVMPHWEADIYAHNLPPDQWNARWWEYVGDMQGIEPPSPRGEEFCDAASKSIWPRNSPISRPVFSQTG